MEYSQGITKKKHKHKPVRDLLFTVALLLCTAIITPLTVHAEDIVSGEVEVEAEHSDGAYVPPGINYKWYATYCPYSGYLGQGVLVYLLDKETGDAVPGTTPKAFPCSATMTTYGLHAQDKYNRYPEVTTWEPTYISWKGGAGINNSGGLMKNSITSNVPDIKKWLKTPYDTNSTQGIWLVNTLWEAECPGITEKFTKEQVILIAEPIVAVQFAQSYKSNAFITTDDSGKTLELHDIRDKIQRLIADIRDDRYTEMSSDLKMTLSTKLALINSIYLGYPSSETEVNQLYEDLNNLAAPRFYRLLGEAYAGTPKKIIDYYNGLSTDGDRWSKSEAGRIYYRKSANAASFVTSNTSICAKARFTALWPAGTQINRALNDNEIQRYSVGMLAMLAWHSDSGDDYDRQSTCDENLIPTEHEAPNESTGGCVIIKTYREKVNDSVTANKGTYYRYNVYNEIEIENEIKEGMDCYNVVEWRITNRLSHGDLNVYNWAGSVPGTEQARGSATGTVMLDESAGYKYLYVLLDSAL